MIPLLARGFRSLFLLVPLIKVQLKHMLDQGTANFGFLEGFPIVKLPEQVGHQHGHTERTEQVDHHQL